jgi:sulfotransferase
VLPLIYQFIGEEPVEHACARVQFDAPLSVHGLHEVRPDMWLFPRHSLPPPNLFEQYASLSLGKDPKGSSTHLITVQAAAPAAPESKA